jgi:hypothetical protein
MLAWTEYLRPGRTTLPVARESSGDKIHIPSDRTAKAFCVPGWLLLSRQRRSVNQLVRLPLSFQSAAVFKDFLKFFLA